MTPRPVFLSAPAIKKMLPRRPVDSHKGRNGHLLILAGSRGMSGAAVLASLGALRSGAGLVTVGIVESERSVVTHQLPEVMTLALPETSEGYLNEAALTAVRSYIKDRRINALAVGPGLSVHPSVAATLKTLLKESQPLVLDADGLNNLSIDDVKNRPGLIITPHVLELARLIKVMDDTVKRDPVHIAERVAREYGVMCVLKGHPSVISDGMKTRLNPTGNSAMATGGMGDVLTGIIAGLLAQGLMPWEAACAGVYLHGLAGDIARIADRGLLASEVGAAVPRALAKIGVR